MLGVLQLQMPKIRLREYLVHRVEVRCAGESVVESSQSVSQSVISHKVEGRKCTYESVCLFFIRRSPKNPRDPIGSRGLIFFEHLRLSVHKAHKKKVQRYDRLFSTLNTGSIYIHYTTNTYFNPKAIMPPRCCIVCEAEASPELQLQYCDACQSALYCSEACQKKDWRKQHNKICKLLNVGHGDMQLRNDIHMRRSIDWKEQFETQERSLDEVDRRFFKLFQVSTFEGSRAAARNMKKFANKLIKHNQKALLFYSLYLLDHSNSEMLLWPNSPLLVLLQLVGPNVWSGNEDEPLQEGQDRATPLHLLAELADPSDYSTHEN
jgi:hypothetical protein